MCASLSLAMGTIIADQALAGVTDPLVVVNQSTLAIPPVGSPVTEPDFGTTMYRVSGTGGGGRFEAPIYSQLQSFSPDAGYMLLDGSDGYTVRRLSGFSRLPLDTSTWNAPRWDPASEHTVLHYDANDNSTLVIQRTNVITGETTNVFTFPPSYWTVLSSQSFDEVSRDGRWMSGMATRFDGRSTIFVVDLPNRALTAAKTIESLYQSECQADPEWGEVPPDWVGISPLGRYLMVQWARDGTDACSGLESRSLTDASFVGRVYDGHQHGDLGVGADGVSEFFMTFELYHPSGRPSIGERSLPGAESVSAPEYLQLLDWGNAGHISCQGPIGACLVSTASDPSNGYSAFENEVFIQRTDGSVDRLAHHRSSICGYFAQPRATWSTDGSMAMFASDWERGSGECDGNEAVDPYLLQLGAQLPTTPPAPQLSDQTIPALHKRSVRVRRSFRLPRRTDQGQGIDWTVLSRATCRVRGAKLVGRAPGTCRIQATAAAATGWRALSRKHRIKIRP